MGFSLISVAEIFYHCFLGFCKGQCSEAAIRENDESEIRTDYCTDLTDYEDLDDQENIYLPPLPPPPPPVLPYSLTRRLVCNYHHCSVRKTPARGPERMF